MKETTLKKIQYCRKEKKEESESSSGTPPKNDENTVVEEKETKVDSVFFIPFLNLKWLWWTSTK